VYGIQLIIDDLQCLTKRYRLTVLWSFQIVHPVVLTCGIDKGSSVGAAAASSTADSAWHDDEGPVEWLGPASYPTRNVAEKESSRDWTATSASEATRRTSCRAHGSSQRKDSKGSLLYMCAFCSVTGLICDFK